MRFLLLCTINILFLIQIGHATSKHNLSDIEPYRHILNAMNLFRSSILGKNRTNEKLLSIIYKKCTKEFLKKNPTCCSESIDVCTEGSTSCLCDIKGLILTTTSPKKNNAVKDEETGTNTIILAIGTF